MWISFTVPSFWVGHENNVCWKILQVFLMSCHYNSESWTQAVILHIWHLYSMSERLGYSDYMCSMCWGFILKLFAVNTYVFFCFFLSLVFLFFICLLGGWLGTCRYQNNCSWNPSGEHQWSYRATPSNSTTPSMISQMCICLYKEKPRDFTICLSETQFTLYRWTFLTVIW